MKTMKVERDEHGYVVRTGIHASDNYDVRIRYKGGEWKVIAPDFRYSREFMSLFHGEARALGRALIMAADWALARNQKERGAE
jgi:hypothetical protein